MLVWKYDEATYVGRFTTNPCRQMPPQRVLVGWGLLPLDWRQAAPLKSQATRSTCSSCKIARIVRSSLLPDIAFLGEIVVNV